MTQEEIKEIEDFNEGEIGLMCRGWACGDGVWDKHPVEGYDTNNAYDSQLRADIRSLLYHIHELEQDLSTARQLGVREGLEMAAGMIDFAASEMGEDEREFGLIALYTSLAKSVRELTPENKL